MKQTTSAIFFDRDGTINIDKGYIYKVKDFHFFNGVIEAMQILNKMDFLLIMVTNQSGIARGIFNERQFIKLTKWIINFLSKFKINIDGFFYCPHHPNAIISSFRKDCICRKPNPGMLLNAKKYFNINMSSSYMIGDKKEDMLAAKLAGIGHPIFLSNEKKQGEIIHQYRIINSFSKLPKLIENIQNNNI
ncbi:D-glycero-beta-D-manno-heptose 1,7-bisphosphate 7-phosphatase [Candidatus Schneideria nysicola]|uniref:D-glycero-beta-D-manno-heptose 1,7-bisphosphate 7-phosphatase n=1 Tax=Candidatus Schneideria nysicola TaxID=1081631 RepID=UPI001CAA71DE|nr:D-glycero-beta-D-manno-heptose 1,7-bisphosphate 7-phosphatase [Candidatus Schneideria nysicola]UAJ65052.1 D-glycero-beta-D-manno-heptose 1,7-bisphosphate 7-phosphatase [Candidatus Schneideria nysicola]